MGLEQLGDNGFYHLLKEEFPFPNNPAGPNRKERYWIKKNWDSGFDRFFDLLFDPEKEEAGRSLREFDWQSDKDHRLSLRGVLTDVIGLEVSRNRTRCLGRYQSIRTVRAVLGLGSYPLQIYERDGGKKHQVTYYNFSGLELAQLIIGYFAATNKRKEHWQEVSLKAQAS